MCRFVEAAPYRNTIVLTANGTHFTKPGAGRSAAPLIVEALAKGETVLAYAFEYACAQLGIGHRIIKRKLPWANGQVEGMNRTIKDTTVKRYHYSAHDQLEPLHKLPGPNILLQ